MKTKRLKALEVSKEWNQFPLKEKSEIILDWSISGGVLGGRRYSKLELATCLGMTVGEIDRRLEDLQATSKNLFSEKSAIRDKVAILVDHAFSHVKDDKARAIMHANILEKELDFVKEKMMSCLNSEIEEERAEVGRWISFYKTLSNQKIESIRILLECNESIVNLLGLFKSDSKNPGNKPKGAFDGFLDQSEADSPEKILTRESAIELLEIHTAPNLPRIKLQNSGPRNPNSGFEDLEKKVDEDVKKTVTAGIH